MDLQTKYPKAKTIVTGHSLGAAIASLAAVDIEIYAGGVDIFINYASPRLGN